MRIGIQTWGSEGDIRPLIALAGGLSSAGHDVTLVATDIEDRDYSRLAKKLGFTIYHLATPVISSPEELERIGFEIISKANPIQQSIAITEHLFRPVEETMYRAALNLCADSDVVVGHYFHHPVRIAAEKTGVPEVSVLLAHNMIPSRHVCPVGLPDLGKWSYPLLWKIVRGIVNRSFLKPVNELKLKEGLLPYSDAMTEAWVSKRLNLVAVSPVLCTRQDDWGEHHRICGFFNVPTEEGAWQMPETLREFLDNGPPPVYMHFGSLMPKSGEERGALFDLFLEAAEQAGCRAIIQVNHEESGSLNGNDRVFYCPPVPHSEVFRRCAAVVHHGGAGTTQSAVRAGAVSVVVAHAAEQSFWGLELKRLGMAPSLLIRRKLTAGALAKQLRVVLDTPSMKENTLRAAQQMEREHGVRRAVELIEETFNPGGANRTG